MACQRKKHSPLCFLWRTRDPVMSERQLKGLAEHKYSCTNASLLDPFMQPWWNWLVTKLPLWMAPNLITICGLAVNIITSLIVVYYSPDGRQEVPGWTCLLCAIGLFIYQSLDAIDGKQARRTGSSSPLGELFDHGCDALSVVFVALAVCVAVGLGHHPDWMFFQCFASLTLFYCAHWQTYVSGTLKFGLFDVTEAQFSIIGIHLACFILGPDFFSLELWGTDIKLRVILVAAISLVSLNSFRTYVIAILGGGVGKNGSTVALPWFNYPVVVVPGLITLFVYIFIAYNLLVVILGGGAGKNGSTIAGTSVLSPAIPFGLVVVPAYVIAQMSEEHLYEEHPTLYIMAFGLVSAKVTNRLVVAHMTKSEMDLLDSVLLGPALLFLNQYFNTFIREYYVLWVCFIWALWDLTRYCSSVCVEICDALNIELFRIVPKIADSSAAKHPTAGDQGANGFSKSSKHKKQ